VSINPTAATDLVDRLRELLTLAPEPEFVRDGKPLAKKLGDISRTQAWKIAKDPVFNQFAPPIRLGPHTTLRRLDGIKRYLDWLAGTVSTGTGDS
jgi:hypothetical protein